jgi:hypothetical protein
LQASDTEDEYILRLTVEPADLVSTYRLDILDAEQMLLEDSDVLNAPQDTIRVSLAEMDTGEYILRLFAFGSDGHELGVFETQQPISVVHEPVTVTISGSDTEFRDDVLIELEVTGEDKIASYLVDINRGMRLVGSMEFAPPDDNIIHLDFSEFETGRYTVRVVALGSNGERLDTDSEEIPYEAPPIEVSFNVLPGEAPCEYVLDISAEQQEQIQSYRVEISDPRSGLQIAEQNYAVQAQLAVSLADQEPGEYRVTLVALGAGDEELATHASEVLCEPPPTPTPTPTIEVGPTISTMETDPEDTSLLLLFVEVTGEDLIGGYRVDVIDEDTGMRVDSIEYEGVPESGALPIPFGERSTGEYTVRLTALDMEEEPIGTPSELSFQYNPQPTPTPTTVPTPTPTPPKGLGEKLRENAPIIIAIGVVVIVALAVVLYFLLRRPAEPEPTPGEGLAGLGGASWAAGDIGQAPIDDADLTNATPFALLPRAWLTVKTTPDRSLERQGDIPITKSPFTFGRKGTDLLISGDDRVSRRHAEIRYHADKFVLEDIGSTHGTTLDARKITGVEDLYEGAEIGIGPTTILVFHAEASTYDDRTNPVPFDTGQEEL